MIKRFCSRRIVLTTTAAVLFASVCVVSFLRTNSRPVNEPTKSMLFSNLAIYRHLGNGVYKIDATPILELTREIIGDDNNNKVYFDETSQSLVVTSTPENLKRIGTRFHNMYRAIGVELKMSQLHNTLNLTSRNGMR